MIRKAIYRDAPQIAEIYNHYISNTVVSFEEIRVKDSEIARRIGVAGAFRHPFLVCEINGRLVGFTSVRKWRERAAYDITLETSIYIDQQYTGRGIGKKLYSALIKESRSSGIHSLVASIALPNDASRKLHKALGFTLVGNFRECGKKFDRLIDVEFWQLMLRDPGLELPVSTPRKKITKKT